MLCFLYNMSCLCFLLRYITGYVMFMLRYITCYVVMLYNMLSYAMLYNMLCCVMFILRCRTYNVCHVI